MMATFDSMDMETWVVTAPLSCPETTDGQTDRRTDGHGWQLRETVESSLVPPVASHRLQQPSFMAKNLVSFYLLTICAASTL